MIMVVENVCKYDPCNNNQVIPRGSADSFRDTGVSITSTAIIRGKASLGLFVEGADGHERAS